jgi:hypothetical protein
MPLAFELLHLPDKEIVRLWERVLATGYVAWGRQKWGEQLQ